MLTLHLHIGDFQKNTYYLNDIQRSKYLLLLLHYYNTEKQLPLDRALCERIAMALTKDEKEAVSFVLDTYFENTATGYVHSEAESQIEHKKHKSLKAKESAARRWGHDNDANALQTQSEGNAIHIPSSSFHINKKRGTRIDSEFCLPIEWGSFALDYHKTWNPDHLKLVFDNFRDYWAAKAGAGGVKLDWFATWRTWVRREKQNGNTTSQQNTPRLSTVERNAAAAREYRQKLEGQRFSESGCGDVVGAIGGDFRGNVSEPVRTDW